MIYLQDVVFEPLRVWPEYELSYIYQAEPGLWNLYSFQHKGRVAPGDKI